MMRWFLYLNRRLYRFHAIKYFSISMGNGFSVLLLQRTERPFHLSLIYCLKWRKPEKTCDIPACKRLSKVLIWIKDGIIIV